MTKSFRIRLWLACLAVAPAVNAQIQIEQVLGQAAMAYEVLVRPRPGVSLGQLAAAFDSDSVRPFGSSGWVKVRSRSMGASSLVVAANVSSLISAAHPNYVIRALETQPSDPDFGTLWGLRNTGQTVRGQAGIPAADIGAAKAWDITLGSRATLVGVIDTGIDYRHPDLLDNVWTATVPYSITLGDTQYTCPAGSHGFNAIALNCDPLDDNNHGTHVSGIIGARGNNGLGVTGVNWKTSLVAIKVLNLFGTASVADAINGIEAAVQMKAQGLNIQVLNASWSTGTASAALEQAIVNAQAAGLLFVAAAGNSASSNDGSLSTYPASFHQPNIVSVAATDNRDQLASFSSYGANSVHLAAPGMDVLSTFIGGGYASLSGTSMAAPHVSGAAALILSRCGLNTAALKQLLLNSVDAVPALRGVTMTGGRLNVYRALQQCGATAVPDFQLSASPPSLTIVPGEAGSTTISVQQFFGLTGSVSLSLSGLPAGVTAAFSPQTLAGSGPSRLSFAVDPSVARGTYPLVVTGTDSTGAVINRVSLSLAIYAPDFSLSGPSSAQMTSAAALPLTISIATLGGFNRTVQLSARGLPAGVTAAFTPPTVTGSGVSILTFTASSVTPIGNFAIPVQGVSGAMVRTVTIALGVAAPPDIALTALPSVLTAAPGGPASTTINIEPLARFEGVVSLTCPVLPVGFRCSFSPATISTIGSSTLAIVAAPNAALGTHPIAVQASSGALVRTTTVQFNVVALPTLAVSLPASLDVGANGVVVVTLPSLAPAGGVDVMLTNSNAAAAGLSLTSLYIPAGQASSSRARISGLGAGQTTITALANGYGPGSALLPVGSQNGTLTFSPASLNLTLPASQTGPASQTVALTLSPPAPAAGLIVTLNSSNPAVASVPVSVTVPGNASQVAVPVSAVASGATTLTATAASYTAAMASVTVSSASSPLVIQTTSLATGQIGEAYAQALSATGGVKPYAWSLVGGTLPSGMMLNPASGLLGGIPLATASRAPLTFRVTDASASPQSVTLTLALTIGAAAPRESIIFPANLTLAVATEATLAVQLSSPAPAAGLVLTLKSNNSSVARLNVDTLFIPGGQSSSSRTRVSGLAAGLALITAEADGYASATVAVQVSGSTGTLAFAPATFSFAGPGTQNVTLTLSPPAPATGLTIQLSSSNAAAASAPASVTVSANASSIAIPITAMGPGQSVVGATAANYGPGSLLVTVSTLPAGLTITSTSLATGEEGQPYAQTLAAVGGTKPYTWSVTGTLPAGLTLNSLTGVLIGIPQAASANTALLFRVADSGTPAKSAFVSLSLNITGAGPVGESILMVTNLALAAGTETALIVQISSPAPVGGLDLVLTNDNPAVAGLNVNTLFIPAGQMSTSRTRVSGRSAGLARVTVSAPNSAPRFAPASVAVQVSGLAGTNQ